MNERLVIVYWHDAWFDIDLDRDEDRRTDYLVETVGYRLGVDARYLHVAAERLPDDEGWRAVTHIPVAVIEEIVELVVMSTAELNGHEPVATVTGGRGEP